MSYLLWALVAGFLGAIVSELLRRREKRRNEAYLWAALLVALAEVQVLKERDRQRANRA